jgi:succinate-acetate transporter protein
MPVKMKPMSLSMLIAAAIGVAYGTSAQIFMRFMSKDEGNKFGNGSFMVMTLGFVFLVPFAVGMLHVYLRQRDGMRSIALSIF